MPGSAPTPAQKAAHVTAQGVIQARGLQQGIKRGSKQFRDSAWRPFVRLSGVLWLELTGVFFGIFALFAVNYLWKVRTEWHDASIHPGAHRSVLGAFLMLLLFGYFAISSFVRARRRERGRS